jgi:hypothetical protein
MQKSTPLEQLPQGSNMQMNQDIERMLPDINPNMNQINPDMNSNMNPNINQINSDMNPNMNQMHNDVNSNMEYQKDMQDHFIKRQFVPQSGMQPQTNDYYEPAQKVYQTMSTNPKIEKSIFQIIKENSKILAILFALLMIVQMEMVQTIIRTTIRMTKIPDNMIFIVSKVLASILGVFLFFIIYRNF